MSIEGYDYIVVGSGAGGGPLAANLAKAGYRVLLLEAGGDPCEDDKTGRGRYMYEVPIFHGLSTEYPECAWDYFVRHYTSAERQRRDSKCVEVGGEPFIWYPRAGALGGCTAHNAMITVVPQDGDWDRIAELTGDDSWTGERMRPYFQRLEDCKYVPRSRTLKWFFKTLFWWTVGLFRGRRPSFDWKHGHGFDGWLPTSEADPFLVLKDKKLVKLLIKSAKSAVRDHVGDVWLGVETRFDPNDSRNTGDSPEGLAFTPLAVDKGKRMGPRDYLLRVGKDPKYGSNLTIKTHALVSRVLFDADRRAVGVEYIDRAHVYRADPNAAKLTPDTSDLPRVTVRAAREVVLAGGAFNTPQLLMLSGVGPAEELKKFGIPVVADLPAVGSNLQDRYEVGVVTEFKKNFVLLEGASFAPPDEGAEPDSFLAEWAKGGRGIYASNGALIGIIKKSDKSLKDPDLYIFGLPGFFKGYRPGYSKVFEAKHNKFTWAVLKARTDNTGEVRLASPNPWDRPLINFKYFGDGDRQADKDLDAVVNGVRFVRSMNERLARSRWFWFFRPGLIKQEEIPGPDVKTDDQLRQFIRDEAWGHHASCTCPIGREGDPGAVLDSRFRVQGVKGLRVVDASVFPKIPGYFIVTAVYMISEKAADEIVRDARAADGK